MKQRSSIDVDVLVVGARAAGASTAMLLARRDLRVLVVDRSDAGADVVSTHALMRPAVIQLARWGLLPEIVAAGTPLVTSTSFHYGDDTVRVAIKPGDGIDGLYAPRRTVLDPILVGGARRSGADVWFGTRAERLLRSRSGDVIGAVLVDRNGCRTSVTSRLVIGADGTNSTVARAVDAPAVRTGRFKAGYAYAHLDDPEPDGFHWYFAPGVTAGVIPTNDRQSCVFVGVSPFRFEHEIRGNAEAGFARILASVAPDAAERLLSQRSGHVRHRVFPGTPGYWRRSYGPGWTLVGDASYFKDPCTAHGITDALLDAETLTDAVVRLLHDGDRHALADHHARHLARTHRLFEITDTIAGHRWDMDEIQRLNRGLSDELAIETERLKTSTV